MCPDGMNHSVTLVGIWTANNTPYWLVRNSWEKVVEKKDISDL